MDALSHISISRSLSVNAPPLFGLLLPRPGSSSLPTHSDTCQEEDMTVIFLKGAFYMTYCSFLVGPTARQSFVWCAGDRLIK